MFSRKIAAIVRSLEHWRLLTFLKTSKKCMNIFSYVKVRVFWKRIHYTVHWDEIQMFKKFPLDRMNDTKYALFFPSRAPIHHSLTFNLRFKDELKRKIGLSKTVCGIYHLRFRFVFIKVYIFVQKNAWTHSL